MSGLRVIVCGGRDFGYRREEWEPAYRLLDHLHGERPFFAVWHGNASGADRMGGRWAERRGVRCFPVPAEWSKYGKRAGPIRNQAMLGQGINLVVAFPGGRGTADMVKRAKLAGVEVIEVAA